MRKMLPVIQFSHMLVSAKLESGGSAIDATAGNGNDTLFLINHVHKNFNVYVFDIQKDAINNTINKLQENLTIANYNKLKQRLNFYCIGHEEMDTYVKERVKVIMFNLGYLPGSKSDIITKPYTTLKAIKKGLNLLLPQGLISIVLYPGHDGGQEEAELITQYVSTLNSYEFNVIQYQNINKNKSPYLIAIEKKR